MIEGYLFDLKGKKRRQALKERIIYILSDYRLYLIIAMIAIVIAQANLISQQQALLRSMK